MEGEIVKKEVGRPTVMTADIISKLEDGFIKGFTDKEACLYADIAPTTLYDFCKDNKEFAERKELLKEQIKMRAKENISEGISVAKSVSLSQWYLERRDKDFKPKAGLDVGADKESLEALTKFFRTLANPNDNTGSESV